MNHTENQLLLEWLNRLNKELCDIYRRTAACLGLSESEFWILYITADPKQWHTQVEICEEWFFCKQTINSAIRSLEEKGYVYLEQVPDSKKKKYVKLTSPGKRFVQENIAPLRRGEEQAISKLSAQERDAYVFLTQKYISNLREEAEIFMKSKSLAHTEQAGGT